MYIEHLAIHNLRSFRKQEIDFVVPDLHASEGAILPNVNLILGTNGTGKTTILRALALAPLATVLEKAGFVPYRLIRIARTTGPTKGAIVRTRLRAGRFEAVGRKPVTADSEVTIAREEDYEVLGPGLLDESPRLLLRKRLLFHDKSPAFFLAGYGATRRVESLGRFQPEARARMRRRYERVVSLFEDHVALRPLSSWLPSIKRTKRFKEISALLNKLLEPHARFTGKISQGEVLFEHGGIDLPYAALSDGFRSFIGWISDLLFHLNEVTPSSRRLDLVEGVVLVDEVDLLLHPEWQRTVVPTIARALPKLQFFFTTHSPIVAGSLSSECIRVVRTNDRGESEVHRYEERIHGLNADQILISPYFGLESSRAPDAVAQLASLSRRAAAGDRDAAREFALELIGDIPAETDEKPSPRRRSASRKRPAATKK
jgi:hypothetical protein